jgi:hypothetical protein
MNRSCACQGSLRLKDTLRRDSLTMRRQNHTDVVSITLSCCTQTPPATTEKRKERLTAGIPGRGKKYTQSQGAQDDAVTQQSCRVSQTNSPPF